MGRRLRAKHYYCPLSLQELLTTSGLSTPARWAVESYHGNILYAEWFLQRSQFDSDGSLFENIENNESHFLHKLLPER